MLVVCFSLIVLCTRLLQMYSQWHAQTSFGCSDVICIPLSNCRWYLCHIFGTAGPDYSFSFLIIVVTVSENKFPNLLCTSVSLLSLLNSFWILWPNEFLVQILQRKLKGEWVEVIFLKIGGKTLLVSNGLPSQVLPTVWPLISANKDKK